jgi:hypothetical protein
MKIFIEYPQIVDQKLKKKFACGAVHSIMLI